MAISWLKLHLYLFDALGPAVILSSCGVNRAFVVNDNKQVTQVTLASDNYKVIDRITGSAEVQYVLMFGGMKRKQLYENAYSDMMTKANLLNSSRAVINMVTEEHLGGVPPFYYKRSITVSGHVIEFGK